MSVVVDLARAAHGAGLVHWAARPAQIAVRARGLGYLASPVTGRITSESELPWHIVERLIMECALDLDALARAGVSAVSPALQGLEMVRARGGGWLAGLHGPRGALDHGHWMGWSAPQLRAADFVIVADRPGWDASAGIATEVEAALARNMQVFFMPEGV